MVPSVLLAGIFSMLFALAFALPLSVSMSDLVLLSVMGIVQLGVGLLLMMVAVRYLASAEIGLLSILEIIFGTLSVWVLIGERPSHATLVGGGVVVAALIANEIAGLRQSVPQEIRSKA
jgi:drug/metabolite transporter (DMT)-like permease